jgi:hypothetical protein
MICMLTPPPEKRRQQRIVSQEAMAYTIFSVHHWAEANTWSFNLSRTGVGFVTRQPLSPGTMICIRAVPAADWGNRELQNIQIPLRVLAEVKWCRQPKPAKRPLWEVGASYLLN